MKRSKKWAILFLVVGLTAIAPLSCTKPGAAPSASTTVAVQQGPLIVQIPASGNLAFAQTADVAFQVSGTVDKINVSVGDAVKKGDVLATLDQTAWQTYLTGLQTALTNAKRSETKAEITLNTDNQRLQQAVNSLSSSPSISTALTNLNKAYDNYQFIKNNFTGQSDLINTARDQVQLASSLFKAVNASADATQVTLLRMQLDVDQGILDDARNQVVTSQQTLDDANATSPQIAAPYDGIVTAVSVTGGQAVAKGTIGVIIADQSKFEAEVLVNETDISNVRIGAIATVQPNAASTVLLPAAVTAISPTATVSSGVVNYKVTVEVSNQSVSSGGATTDQTGGQVPDAIQRGTSRVPGQGSSQGTPGQGRTFTTGLGQNGANAAATSFQLKSGLTVSINILAMSVPNAIQVPSRAITRQAGQSTVKVLNADGTTETRTVTVGTTNGTNTQIVTGLSVGEQLSVPQSNTAATTNPRLPGGGGGTFFIR